MSFPKQLKTKVPPIKIQGIKTKLIGFILSSINWDEKGTWIEPFLGSGSVAFNAAPKKAILCDTNIHVINFYNALKDKKISAYSCKNHLEVEGKVLLEKGGEHFYEIRKRFNAEHDPHDFLFLTRSCFNGVMRFNKSGGFNVPFCKKPDRFRQAYVTKICNQIDWVEKLITQNDWQFINQDWKETLSSAKKGDFVYLDPPYIGRHTDYFNSWKIEDADDLVEQIHKLPCGFAYSMWAKNIYRENLHLQEHFEAYQTTYFSHFYHVGSGEENRNEMIEALVVGGDAILKNEQMIKVIQPSQNLLL
jgi:DNA adenine methylase